MDSNISLNFPSNCRPTRRETIAISQPYCPSNEHAKRRASLCPENNQLYPRYNNISSSKCRNSENSLFLSVPTERARRGSSILSIDKNGERSRRNSVISIGIKTSNDNHRLSATEILKNWRDVTITAKIEQKLAIAKLDAMMRNMKWQVFDQAKKARKLHVKCMWLLLAVVLFGILVYEITRQGIRYYYNPIITTFTVTAPPAIEFPQVYVCMAASANISYMLQHPREFSRAKFFRERIIKAKRKKRQNEISYLVSHHDHHDQDHDDHDAYIDHYLNSHETFLTRSRRQIINITGNSSDFDPYEFFNNAGYKVNETFLECSFRVNTYKKLNCAEIIEPILDVNYGLCYIVRIDEIKQSVAGAGLTLIINSHVDLYPTDDINAPRSSGLYVSINKDYDPTNWQKACAAPGHYTKIDIAGTRIEMLNLKSGSLIQPCVEQTEAAEMMRVFNCTYSRTTCQLDCMLQEFKRRCQCILVVDKKVLRNDVLRDIEFCTPNRSQTCIVPNVTKNKAAMANINACRSKCHTPCTSWHYVMRTSSAPLHPPVFHRFGLSYDTIMKNLIRIDVSFPAIEYAELVQSPSLTIFRLIADIGGHMNLWMGASIVTVIWTFIIMLRYYLSKCLEILSNMCKFN